MSQNGQTHFKNLAGNAELFSENCFLQKGIYLCKEKYVRVKEETTKLCDKLYMKMNLSIEFNRKKYNLNYKSHIYKNNTES